MNDSTYSFVMGGVYLDVSDRFQRGILPGLSRTLKAEKHDAGIVEKLNYMDNCIYVDKDEIESGQLLEDNETNVEYRIRKLTPKECWRLMSFSDEDFEKAKWMSEEESKRFLEQHPTSKRKRNPENENQLERTSDSQLYKQAGNSIVVDVLYYIFLNLYEAMPYLFDDLKVSSYFSGIGAFEKALDKLFAEVKTDV